MTAGQPIFKAHMAAKPMHGDSGATPELRLDTYRRNLIFRWILFTLSPSVAQTIMRSSTGFASVATQPSRHTFLSDNAECNVKLEAVNLQVYLESAFAISEGPNGDERKGHAGDMMFLPVKSKPTSPEGWHY